MLKKYQIWNKTDSVITPIGEVFTAEQWQEKYPASKVITYVLARGEVNGAFCDSLAQMVQVYTDAGCDFTGATTDEEKLQRIEDFEDSQNNRARESSNMPTPEERIAAALEFIALQSVPDAE